MTERFRFPSLSVGAPVIGPSVVSPNCELMLIQPQKCEKHFITEQDIITFGTHEVSGFMAVESDIVEPFTNTGSCVNFLPAGSRVYVDVQKKAGNSMSVRLDPAMKNELMDKGLDLSRNYRNLPCAHSGSFTSLAEDLIGRGEKPSHMALESMGYIALNLMASALGAQT